MTSSLSTEIDWDGFTKSGMEESGCIGGCYDCSSWRVVGEKGATMHVIMYFCVGGGRSYWLLGMHTYLATNSRWAEYINKLRGHTDVRTYISLEIILFN